ncbi:postacrosomal sheath WW domain-binding protein [Gadus morhua]|uniref:postacrosomal sheath WW domain-binding protein n=1 Tax=Gadus morhua TaxID=8049 RepID=UPI0011B4A34B|nr:postacrosomal sheath WW domain-binding protein [Gadus morhua]
MSLNRNHSQNGGVLVHNGESVLRECKNVELSFSDVSSKTDLLKGTKKGSVYLTPYRLVFVSSNKDCLGSCMFPYYLMKGCSIEQPVFAANFIKGTVSAEPGGGWEGRASFKMSFTSGGAIELGQHLFKLATNASRPPAAQPGGPSFGYPSPGGVNGFTPAPPGYYPQAPQHNGFYQPPPPQQNGFYQPPPPQPNGFYQAPPPQPNGFYQAPPPQPNGFYQAPPHGNMGYPFPTTAAGVYPSAPAYMAPPPAYPGPPQNWSAPSPTPGNPKAMEAAGRAYYNPTDPHQVYMPMEQPPPYAPYPGAPEKKNN